jgi:hypothetical protein
MGEDSCSSAQWKIATSYEGMPCLKVVTGTAAGSGGSLALHVDLGHEVVQEASDSFPLGSVVLDKCYWNLVSVQVQAINADAWQGTIEYSPDGGSRYFSMVCTSCSGSTKDTATTRVDAGNSPLAGATNCLGGQACKIEKPSTTMTTTLVYTLEVLAGEPSRWSYFGHNGSAFGLFRQVNVGVKWRMQNGSSDGSTSYCTLQTLQVLDTESSYLSLDGNTGTIQLVPAADTPNEHWMIPGLC